MEIIETVRSEAQRREKVERAMIEEEGLVLEEAVRVSTERQARAKAMRFERDRQIEAKWQASKEEAARMEAKRQAVAMKRPLEFSFRLCLINFSLEFSFRLCKIEFSLKFSFRMTFQISYWLQIAFRFVSD